VNDELVEALEYAVAVVECAGTAHQSGVEAAFVRADHLGCSCNRNRKITVTVTFYGLRLFFNRCGRLAGFGAAFWRGRFRLQVHALLY